jgi:hypothetical protein
MRVPTAVCLLFVVGVAVAATAKDIIDTVNAKKTSWKAAPNKFSGWTKEQQRTLIGAAIPPYRPYTPSQMAEIRQFEDATANSLPESFDSRVQWPKCVHPIRDQVCCNLFLLLTC